MNSKKKQVNWVISFEKQEFKNVIKKIHNPKQKHAWCSFKFQVDKIKQLKHFVIDTVGQDGIKGLENYLRNIEEIKYKKKKLIHSKNV